MLRCERCGNAGRSSEGEAGFDATKLYVHEVVLDGEGLVADSRIQADVEGSEEEITCRACGSPVEQEAQGVLEADPSDPNGLDLSSANGVACESLP